MVLIAADHERQRPSVAPPVGRSSRAKRWLSIWADTRAVAATEFALIAPILMIMLVGATEYTRMTIVQSRLDALSYNMGQVLVANTGLSQARIDQLLWRQMVPGVFRGMLSGRIRGDVAQVRAAPAPAIDWESAPANRSIGEDMIAMAGDLKDGQSVVVINLRYILPPLAFRSYLPTITLNARSVHRQFAPM